MNLNNIVFNCYKNHSQQSINKFQNAFIPKYGELENYDLKTQIGKYIYKKTIVIEEIDTIFHLMRTKWHQLQTVVLYNTSLSYTEIMSSRNFINQSFEAILECLQLNIDNFELYGSQQYKEEYIAETLKYLNKFSNLVLPINRVQEDVMLRISMSSKANINCPVYQYFHTFLDIQYYMLTIEYVCGISKEHLEKKLESLLKDLVLLSKINFKRPNKSTTFTCDCTKNFWLMCEILTEKVGPNDGMFWKIFNRVLEKEEPLFVLCMLKDVAFLQCINNNFQDVGCRCERIKPNYDLLMLKLKELLLEANSETLAQCFKIIEPLICNLWLKEAKIEIYQIIWDFYSKRLNVSNNQQSSTLTTAIKIVKLIDKILTSPKGCTDDFEIFVGMLLCHLREYPTHWGKIKGRIYSQLGPNKVKDLSETGITHVTMLFMSLASVNFDELAKKITAFLDNLPQEKKQTALFWNIYAAFVIIHVQEGRSIEKVAPSIIQMLQDASCDQRCFRLIRDFIKNFEDIVNCSVYMNLHQWLLLTSWLGKYMSICYLQDLNKTLDVILMLLDKVSNADSWLFWEQCFKEEIFPSLKQMSLSQTAPMAIGKIAGKLCLLITNSSSEILNYFNSESISSEVSSAFLDVVLESYPNSFIITPQQENLVIQSWVKICLLTIGPNKDLATHILKLDIFPAALKSHLKSASDPIYGLIEYLGSDLREHTHSSSISKLSETCFGQADKFLSQYLNHPEHEAIVLRIYTFFSLLFLHCGALIYNRNKSTTPLTKLIQSLILPTEFLIGKKVPHNFVLGALKKTWHLFFEAVVKLNVVIDTFLERTLRDMVTKYMPYFSTVDSPITKCIENNATASVILEKISAAYFKHPVKESGANILKALKIINDFVLSTTSVTLLRLLVNKTLYGLFELVLFHPQRNTAIGVIKVVTCSALYSQVNQDFRNVVLAVTEKHLAFNTINYFQLMNILSKFVPADIKALMANIKQEVANVERKRGVGFDKSLRLNLEKLENS